VDRAIDRAVDVVPVTVLYDTYDACQRAQLGSRRPDRR